MTTPETLRADMRRRTLAPDAEVIGALRGGTRIDDALRNSIHGRAVGLVNGIRNDARPGLMEVFLAEYGLSTEEGHRADVPRRGAAARAGRGPTIDDLIEDKIAPSNGARIWGTRPRRWSTRRPGVDADRQGAEGR